MHQKWYKNGFGYKNGNLEKNNLTKFSKLIFICSIYKHICEFQHLSTLREFLYPLFVTCAGFCESITKCKQCFCFWGEPFQWRFPSRHLHRSLLCSAHRSRYPCFSIFVLYFSSVPVFVPLYDLNVVSKKKTYKFFANFLMINPWVFDKYIVTVTYVVNDNRLGCFVSEKQTRKRTAEFHEVTPVKPFIDCLIVRYTTLTWNEWKLVHTIYIFLYISKKISRYWQH